MSGVLKRDHAPPTGQTPGKKASNLYKEELKPDVKVCSVFENCGLIVFVYNLIVYTTQP